MRVDRDAAGNRVKWLTKARVLVTIQDDPNPSWRRATIMRHEVQRVTLSVALATTDPNAKLVDGWWRMTWANGAKTGKGGDFNGWAHTMDDGVGNYGTMTTAGATGFNGVGFTTEPLKFDATSEAVRSALEALANIGVVHVKAVPVCRRDLRTLGVE